MELLNRKPVVLCILDEFSYNCFKPECSKLIYLNKKTLEEDIKNNKIDFLLCEPAWRPIGSHFTLGTRDKVLRKKLYDELKEIVRSLQSDNIPTVFWNKEDNEHYHHFKYFAELFDHIFTTDIRTIPLYKKDCRYAKSIETLLFGAQPRLHNPIRYNNMPYEGDIFFAGGWYPFSERVKELNELLDLPPNIKLHIYERGFDGKKSKFPSKFYYRMKKGIKYLEMSEKYKKYPIMINVNSVKGSSTMFSRRVPEALLCGTTIISSPSLSLKLYFPHVFFESNKEGLYKTVKSLLQHTDVRLLHNHLAKRNVLINHTYINRMEQICNVIGVSTPKFRTGVVNLYMSSKDDNDSFLEEIKKQTYTNVIDTIKITDNYEKSIKILEELFIERKLPNGEINENIGFIFLYYPQNKYQPNYILDLVLSYKFFKEMDVIGKACIITEDKKVLYPELENTFTNLIHPHTISISLSGDTEKRKNKLIYLRKSIGDTLCPKEIEPLKFYSTDRYNFIFKCIQTLQSLSEQDQTL